MAACASGRNPQERPQPAATKKRRAAAAAFLLLAFVALLPVAVPVGAQEPEPDPCFVPPGNTIPQKVPAPVCGTTVIDASGHAGITLDIRQEVILPAQTYKVELLEGATYAFVGLADPDPDSCGRDIDPFFAMCFSHRLYWTRMPFGVAKNIRGSGRVEAGVHELYVLSDGPVRATLVFEGLEGANELQAGGAIQGSSELLEPECGPSPTCENVGWGSATHTVSPPGFAAMFAHSYNPMGRIDPLDQVPYPGSRSLVSCLLPQYGPATGDPPDYQTGCPMLPTEEGNWPGNLIDFVGGSILSAPFGGAATQFRENWNPDGPVYAGFVAQQVSTEMPGGGYGAFGVWFEEGIHDEPEPEEGAES